MDERTRDEAIADIPQGLRTVLADWPFNQDTGQNNETTLPGSVRRAGIARGLLARHDGQSALTPTGAEVVARLRGTPVQFPVYLFENYGGPLKRRHIAGESMAKAVADKVRDLIMLAMDDADGGRVLATAAAIVGVRKGVPLVPTGDATNVSVDDMRVEGAKHLLQIESLEDAAAALRIVPVKITRWYLPAEGPPEHIATREAAIADFQKQLTGFVRGHQRRMCEIAARVTLLDAIVQNPIGGPVKAEAQQP